MKLKYQFGFFIFYRLNMPYSVLVICLVDNFCRKYINLDIV